jgi:multidrug resistance efflux pump
MRFTAIFLTLILSNIAFANTVIYESQSPNGIPDFSQAPVANENNKTIVINTPPVNSDDTNNAQNNNQPVSSFDTPSNINQQLEQQDKQLYLLQQELNQAQIALQTAKENLANAQTAQNAGLTKIGGDEYLDIGLIKHLQEEVANAELNYQAALNAYNTYAQNLGNTID